VSDVGVRGDRIEAIRDLSSASALKRLSIKGLTVAPGFIDIHSHARGGLLATPTAENYLRQGVITAIEGNDGGSPVPIREFLDKVTSTPVSINIGMFVGQGSVREKVLGLENRPATADEIERMRELVRQAMRDGAMGLSTGLFYVPGNFSAVEEVIALAKATGELGGMHISHMRDEADRVLDAVRETIRIGEEGGLPTRSLTTRSLASPTGARASRPCAWSRRPDPAAST
jgi:N-acyl-D-amino-acid deacylase